jgi:plastocyanin
VAPRSAWKRMAVLVVSAQFSLLAVGCKKSGDGASNHVVSYSTVDPSTAGSVEGDIRFPATPPPSVPIDMTQDPGCGKGPNTSEQYVVTDGNLANVFVYVRSGLGNRIYAPPAAPVVLDQKGCRYVPHVIGVMAGQPVEFRTSDPTMHDVNVQPSAAGNPPFDLTQAPNGAPLRHTFGQAETMIPVRCNNHPWMQAFINVAANPFFAISNSQGHYVIRGLPPGTYTLVAVQEKLGEKQQSITVSPHQAAEADFTF